MTPLKIAAFDGEDLEVLSAHLQDAVLTVGDIRYLAARKRLAFVARRFAWERVVAGGDERSFERRLTGVHFDRVLAARTRGIDRSAPDTILELLAVRFEPSEPPAGTVELMFAGGKDLRLDVECVEAALADLGPAWPTASCPEHAAEDKP